MRRIATFLALIGSTAAILATTAAGDDAHTYKLVIFNAFGLVEGSEIKIANVPAGTVTDLAINEDKQAVLTVELVGPQSVLGSDSECSAEPQSLIAEYFVNCQPAGPPLAESATLAKPVAQTVQNDLVFNTLRMPFKQRFQLLINEFGTALAGNPENLNAAIEAGAPALVDLHKALRLLANQNKTIAQLNVDSDEIIGDLAARTGDVVDFVETAGDAAAASAERRDDLSTDFDLLDDALVELEPTMVELARVARESTPLLADLRRSAPQLNTLALNTPDFANATERSLVALGRASKPGRKALARGRDELKALADAGVGAPRVAELVADLLSDISDQRRSVEEDRRAERTCDDATRPCYSTGRTDADHSSGRVGYTGMEGILNYFYYQAGSLNQFDAQGHLLHFSFYDIFEGPCGAFNPDPGAVPAEGGGTTTNLLDAENCVGWLGNQQPGINEDQSNDPDLRFGRYDGSVCPDGSTHLDICDPNLPAEFSAQATQTRAGARAAAGAAPPAEGQGSGEGAGPQLPGLPPGLPADPDDVRDQIQDLLDVPGASANGLLGSGRNDRRGKGGRRDGGGRNGGGDPTVGADQAAEDLLDFLFGS